MIGRDTEYRVQSTEYIPQSRNINNINIDVSSNFGVFNKVSVFLLSQSTHTCSMYDKQHKAT